MVNSLLVSSEQEKLLYTGTDYSRRLELVTQILPSFELANPPRFDHVLPRLEIMYRILLREPEVKARMSQCSNGFDFEYEFCHKVGITLDHWLFVVFAIYCYFLNIGSALDPNPNYMIINPDIFRGESGITEQELLAVLSVLSAPPAMIRAKNAEFTLTDARYDFVEFRSTPLIELEKTKLVPTDLTFILEKCHTGVHWALHDRLDFRRRRDLFAAWGILFEEYVHWLLKGWKTNQPMFYLPCPKWKGTSDESFDGILVKEGVLLAAEYKGGIISRQARYAADSRAFTTDLERKISVGCEQLAKKIGAVFSADQQSLRELADFDCRNIRAVLPVLVVQDHILRVPFFNWYLNREFQNHMQSQRIRDGVVIRPLTVLTIDDLESLVHSVEGADFDLVYALHNRALRDSEMLSWLPEWLSEFPDYGHKASPRIRQILDQVTNAISSFLFPGDTDISSQT